VGTDEYEVVRQATVPAAPEAVYDLIVDFRRWPEWSPWEDIDPELRRTYSGSDAGVGAVYEWAGNRKAGEGRMEIIEATAPSRVVIDLRFIKPFKAHNTTTFELDGSDGGTRVTWRMVGQKTLMTKVMGIFKSMDKMIGPDFEKGLDRLKGATQT
jgi:hypothetical protein